MKNYILLQVDRTNSAGTEVVHFSYEGDEMLKAFMFIMTEVGLEEEVTDAVEEKPNLVSLDTEYVTYLLIPQKI